MSLLALRIFLFVGEGLLASLLLPVLAFAVTRLIGRAALRHLVWLTAFGVLAVLPLAALLLPAQVISLPVPAVASQPAMMPQTAMAAPMPQPDAMAVPAMMAAPAARATVITTRPMPAPLTLENGLLLLAALWTAGVFWNLGRMALGAVGLMRLRRSGAVFVMPDAPCEVRLAPASGPATFGIFRPVILMPQAARGWQAARLQAVLAHEAAHVRRYDAVSQALVRLVCAAYWISPLVWLGARALRRDAEIAADDAVLAQGMTPSDYAAELLQLAAETHGAVPGIAMAGSALAARVQSVLATNTSRKGVTRMDLAKMLSLGLVVTLLLGTARFDLALAQAAPAKPEPVAKPAPAPAPGTAPNVDIEINRNIAPKADVEVEAIKARADAVTAKARARAEAEKDPAKRAQYREEAARAAATAAATKARADETRQRMAQVQQKALEARQRALAVEHHAADARMKADDAMRRAREAAQRESRIVTDEAVLAAARLQKLTVSPVEVDERIRSYGAQGNVTAEQLRALRERAEGELFRKKLFLLQNETAPRPIEGTDRPRETRFLTDQEVLAAARLQKLTVSPVEVDERLNNYRQRALVDVVRDKLAALQVVAAPSGTLPLARLLLPLPPGAPQEAIDNTLRATMQVRDAAGNCAGLEKISRDPVFRGSVFNLGDFTLVDLDPKVQKALAETKSGEVATPVLLADGVELFARCDARAVPPRL